MAVIFDYMPDPPARGSEARRATRLTALPLGDKREFVERIFLFSGAQSPFPTALGERSQSKSLMRDPHPSPSGMPLLEARPPPLYTVAMDAESEHRVRALFANPPKGSALERAREYGIDLGQLYACFLMTPSERLDFAAQNAHGLDDLH